MTGPTASTLLARVAASTLWLARWLLVLLLVCDQIGSPLHLHKHDSGVDALWSQSHGERHIEEGDVSPMLSHAVLAVRSQGERQLGSADLECSLDVIPGAAQVPSPDPTAIVRLRESTSDAQPHRHRSLPPEGRAPPIHA